jgi:hypothetical protein
VYCLFFSAEPLIIWLFISNHYPINFCNRNALCFLGDTDMIFYNYISFALWNVNELTYIANNHCCYIQVFRNKGPWPIRETIQSANHYRLITRKEVSKALKVCLLGKYSSNHRSELDIVMKICFCNKTTKLANNGTTRCQQTSPL